MVSEVRVAHSTTFGTMKNSSSEAGALRTIVLGIVAVGHHVLAHLHLHRDDRSQRLDLRYIDLVQLLDPVQDGIEFALEARNVRLLHLDARKLGDAPHRRLIDRHV